MNAKALIVALPVKMQELTKEDAYKMYLAKCAKVMTENTAKLVKGSYIQKDFSEIIGMSFSENKNNKTSEEVISDIRNKLKKMNEE